MLRVPLFLALLIVAVPARADESPPLAACLDRSEPLERLNCIDATAATESSGLSREDAEAVQLCAAEPSPLGRLDCYTRFLQPAPAPDAAPEAQAPAKDVKLPSGTGTVRTARDLGLLGGYEFEPRGGDCSEEELQERHAASTRQQGEAGAGAGTALLVSSIVLGAIVIGVADTTQDLDAMTGLGIGAGALATGASFSFGAAGVNFQKSWVHSQLQAMESRRCGGSSFSIERR